MGKVKIEIYCYLIADIWQKFCRHVCWVVLHQAYHFRPNLSIWLVAMATEMLNLRKNNNKSTSQKLWGGGGGKLKLCRIVYNINLCKKSVFYCHCLNTLVAMATLNFHGLIIGKNENLHLLLFHCRYFDESFFRNVWWVSSTKHILFVQTSQFEWLSWQPKGWICEKYSKLNSEAIWEIKLKLCRNVHSISFYKSIVFIAVAYALWLLWQLRVSIDLLWGKWKLALIAVLLQISWQNVFRIVCWVVLHQA